ncbi:MAG: HAMP domain-containing protein [Chloroflexi bacterium]|nr:HAMP domain-containing protein [Chloroflexota bacterium]MYC01568.1 HAMP domain-containing protein [Chloroflexota bacterium]
MSLRMRIVTATGLVVLLTGLTIALVAYFATESRLGVFVEQIGDDEAGRLALNLSRAYTETGGWQTADAVLAEAGYIYPAGVGALESQAGEENHVELFHRDPIRVVIADADGRVLLDNFGRLVPGSTTQRLDGRSETVVDLTSNQSVGQVYVDVDHELLSSESEGFLGTLFYIILIGGLATAALAISLAFWLSRRVIAPVQALTEATQVVARGDETRLPVTTSDELGRMSEAFNRMSSTLEAQRELRRQLVNDVSHELNTPLSVIQLEAAGLRDGLQSPATASAHIIQEVERLRGLVTDLDSLAETDRGELRLELESMPVGELLSAELERWQPQAQERNVRLSLQAPAALPDVDVDCGRMSQALGNLLSNAINSVEPGGNVVLDARTEAEESLSISVVDDGAGIDPADLPHIFDRFYRTEQARNRAVGGTGLGLAITRAIVEAHGGVVAASSEGAGQGATLSIRLPLDGGKTAGSRATSGSERCGD